jgi:hypothetical protein
MGLHEYNQLDVDIVGGKCIDFSLEGGARVVINKTFNGFGSGSGSESGSGADTGPYKCVITCRNRRRDRIEIHVEAYHFVFTKLVSYNNLSVYMIKAGEGKQPIFLNPYTMEPVKMTTDEQDTIIEDAREPWWGYTVKGHSMVDDYSMFQKQGSNNTIKLFYVPNRLIMPRPVQFC